MRSVGEFLWDVKRRKLSGSEIRDPQPGSGIGKAWGNFAEAFKLVGSPSPDQTRR
jgi:hypothetical protein